MRWDSETRSLRSIASFLCNAGMRLTQLPARWKLPNLLQLEALSLQTFNVLCLKFAQMNQLTLFAFVKLKTATHLSQLLYLFSTAFLVSIEAQHRRGSAVSGTSRSGKTKQRAGSACK